MRLIGGIEGVLIVPLQLMPAWVRIPVMQTDVRLSVALKEF